MQAQLAAESVGVASVARYLQEQQEQQEQEQEQEQLGTKIGKKTFLNFLLEKLFEEINAALKIRLLLNMLKWNSFLEHNF